MAWEGPVPLTWGPRDSTRTASVLPETADLTDTSVSSFPNKCDILFLKAPYAGTLLHCYYSEGRPVTYSVLLPWVTSPVLLVLRLPLSSPRTIVLCDLVTHTVSPRDQALSHGTLLLKAHRAPFCYLLPNNSAMNLLLLFYKIIAVGKGFEDHPAFCNIYPWGWNRVLANLGPYNLPNCSLDFIFDILNLGLNPKFQETRPKDLEGHFRNYQRSLQWGKLFPSTLSSCLSVPPWF